MWNEQNVWKWSLNNACIDEADYRDSDKGYRRTNTEGTKIALQYFYCQRVNLFKIRDQFNQPNCVKVKSCFGPIYCLHS
jgi:hypothetical protein